MNKYPKYFKTDIMAGMVVFLVALPLCLGIAVASGASPFAGVITGIIGGILVGAISYSHLSVTGPAAGLIAIVLASITELGYEGFLLAVCLAGAFQLLLGFAKAGTIANYFPTNVIEGMLTAIGIIIIKKELPHAIGYDKAHEGDFFSLEYGSDSGLFTEIIKAINYSHWGAVAITLISVGILLAFTKVPALKKIKVVPGALVAVIMGILVNEWWIRSGSPLAITGESHLVRLPVVSTVNEFFSQFRFPDFGRITEPRIWIVALTFSVVASIETLLCIEASDKMDPLKRFTDTNQELKAQGIGNMISGLLGGLPMTSVIVRTSANVNAGGRTKLAAIAHGLFLLIAVLLIPSLLNKMPMATLAAILIMIGLKLASPKVFIHMWKNGLNQFIPFLVTVCAVVYIDLLKGVGIGLLISVFYILKQNLKLAYFFTKEAHHEGEIITIDLAQEVSFLNKAAIKKTLGEVLPNSTVIINASQTVYIDFDVIEMIRDFLQFGSRDKEIKVELIGFKDKYSIDSYSHVHSK